MTNAALLLLHSMVSTAAWASTPKQVFSGGTLSGKLEPITEKAPQENTSERREWDKQNVELVLEGSDFHAALDSMKFFISKSAVPPTPAAVELLTVLKLTE